MANLAVRQNKRLSKDTLSNMSKKNAMRSISSVASGAGNREVARLHKRLQSNNSSGQAPLETTFNGNNAGQGTNTG